MNLLLAVILFVFQNLITIGSQEMKFPNELEVENWYESDGLSNCMYIIYSSKG